MLPTRVLLVAGADGVPADTPSEVLALIRRFRIVPLSDIAVRIPMSDPMMPAAEPWNQLIQPPFDLGLIGPELDIPADAHGPTGHRTESGGDVTMETPAFRTVETSGQVGKIAVAALAPHPKMQPSAAIGPFGSGGLERDEDPDIGRRGGVVEMIGGIDQEPAGPNCGDMSAIESVIVVELRHERSHAA